MLLEELQMTQEQDETKVFDELSEEKMNIVISYDKYEVKSTAYYLDYMNWSYHISVYKK